MNLNWDFCSSNRFPSRMLSTAGALMLTAVMSAQGLVIKGTVKDEMGEPLIGASVRVKGTNQGAQTDLDGNFSLNADKGQTLEISYVGMKPTAVTVTGQPLAIILKEDAGLMEEVVVVGYGVQKKSVVTAAIAKVDADDLNKVAPIRIDNALQGLAAGINVTSSSGQPGEGSRIRVRGIGTINDSDPLFIVDGMPIEGGIDYLSPSDIESIEVLKDAASGAVYGARAANGVILVTTKAGKVGRTAVNYNFSMGWQTKWRKRDVLDATEYAIMMNEGYVNSGRAPIYDDPYNQPINTDWQDQIFNDRAPIQKHEVNVSGATDKVNYYLSANFLNQEGIIGGDKGMSNYKRFSLRSNTKYTVFDKTKDRNIINKLTLTSNIAYTNSQYTGVRQNQWAHGLLNSALTMAPTLPVTYTGDEATAKLAEYKGLTSYVPQYDENGGLYMVPGADYDNQMNPVAYLNNSSLVPSNWRHKFVGNFAGELEIGYGIKYRLSYGVDMAYNGQESHVEPFYLTSSYNWGGNTSAYASANRSMVWQLENVLTWDKTFGKHGVNVVLGQSAKESSGYYVNGSRKDLVDITKPYVSYATGDDKNDISAAAGPYDVATLSSLFARASYNYDERYMIQGTVRRDGSSRFGSNNHYGTFPSFSAGWNIHNEKFMENTRGWLSSAKLRGSWGKNGNESIGNFRYTSLTTSAGAYNTYFGRGEGSTAIGTRAAKLENRDLKWEESVQTDLGLDLGFFNYALTFGVDYFIKKTNGMLMDMPIANYVGLNAPVGNVGEMENRGVEFELGYKFKVKQVNFAIKGNAAYLKNKLINLGNTTGTADYDNVQGLGVISRAENGQPWPFFYGYKTNGIFQNVAEVNAYTNANGALILPDAQPGDLRFVDVNGDGAITAEDKTNIGKGTPDWTFGLNFNLQWKGLDFNMFWQGTAGNDIYDATLRVDKQNQNLPSWMLGRWTGEGTSNTVPRYILGSNNNTVSSDFNVFDGSYLRLKNVQLGYTFPKHIMQKAFIQNLRVYVMAENLFTFTKYHGYDPEISSTGTSLGVDYGVYPQARTWTIGLNLGF